MRTSITLATILLLAAFAQPGSAQQEQAREITPEEFLQLVREDVKKDRVQLITAAMDFSAEEAAAFWPVYEQYEAEFSEVGDHRLALIQDYADNYWTMTDDKAAELAQQALSIEEQRTALKKKYFTKFAEALSPVTAARFLQVDNQINMLIDLQLATQMPLVQKAE